MIILALCSLKGGVGKTTCAINTAYALAKRGWNTLLVDTDPQGSVGLSLSAEASANTGLYEIITQNKPLDEVVLKTKLDTLSIITAGQIPGAEISKWTSSLQTGEVLAPFFRQAEAASYDLVVVDTPSGIHGPTEGVLRNATHILVPQQCEPLALRCLMQMLDFLGQLQNEGINCIFSGVILTMIDETSPESQAVKADIINLLPSELICKAMIPRDPVILTASVKGLPLGLLNGDAVPMTALTFDQLAAELEPRLSLNKTSPTTSSDEHISFLVR